jgi:D-sedoheptulose 7-phosphate isomerase
MEDRRSLIKCDIADSIAVKQGILNQDSLIDLLLTVSDRICEALRNGNKIIFAGNGGSAADSQHLAAEFVSKLEIDRPGLPAISLSTDTSIITAIGNDYGFENLFRRQLEAQSRAGDLFVGITTSGRSINILNGFLAAKKLGLVTVGFCGNGGELERLADYVLRVPSSNTARIQESHILLGHLICKQVERKLFVK